MLHPPVTTDSEGRQESGLKRKQSGEKKEKAATVKPNHQEAEMPVSVASVLSAGQ